MENCYLQSSEHSDDGDDNSNDDNELACGIDS